MTHPLHPFIISINFFLLLVFAWLHEKSHPEMALDPGCHSETHPPATSHKHILTVLALFFNFGETPEE